jgi:hypothetical protein
MVGDMVRDSGVAVARGQPPIGLHHKCNLGLVCLVVSAPEVEQSVGHFGIVGTVAEVEMEGL